MKRIALTNAQYNVLSDFCLDIAKAIFLSNVTSYFLPLLGAKVETKVFLFGVPIFLIALGSAVILAKEEKT